MDFTTRNIGCVMIVSLFFWFGSLSSQLLLQAYQHLGEVNIPKFTVIVAQKNHHMKLFQAGGSITNVPPGMSLQSVFYF